MLPMTSPTVGTSLNKNGSAKSMLLPNRAARRRIRLKTYPRPSFDGSAPSAIEKHNIRIWSAITRKGIGLSSYVKSENDSIL